MRIGLLGFGVVGRGVYDLTKDRTDMQVAKVLCLEDISLPDAQAVKNIAGEKIINGSLDSLAKIKAIDEVLGTDLKLYIK